MTDAYIQEINKATNSIQLESIVYNCNIHLAQIVKEYLNTSTEKTKITLITIVKKVKFYISNHLHDSIRISNLEISSMLSFFSQSHFSKVFKKYTHVTLSEFRKNLK